MNIRSDGRDRRMLAALERTWLTPSQLRTRFDITKVELLRFRQRHAARLRSHVDEEGQTFWRASQPEINRLTRAESASE